MSDLTIPDFPPTPAYTSNDFETALTAAREGNPAPLAAIVAAENLVQSEMILLGTLEDTPFSMELLFLFQRAAQSRNMAEIECLVQSNAHEVARFQDSRPLHVFAQEAFAPGLKFLLEQGCNPDVKDTWGNTPMRILLSSQAVYTSQVKTHIALKVLLGAKACPNVGDNDQTTPLHIAVAYSSPAVVRSLIQAGANVNVLNAHQETPLTFLLYLRAPAHRAFVYRVLRLLLEAKADVNPTGTLNTPLQRARKFGSSRILQTLADHGAN